MRAHAIVLLLVLLLTSITMVEAQTTPLCPPKALLSIGRAGAACANLEAGSACYGSGNVTFPAWQGAEDAPELVQLGDRVSLRDIEVVYVTPTSDDDETVSIVSLVISVSNRTNDYVTVLMVQDASLSSVVFPSSEVTMQAIGTVPVRAAPEEHGAVITELSVNQRLTAIGQGGGWMRVVILATGELGWASAALLRAEGDVSVLPYNLISEDGYVQPFESAHFLSGSRDACGGALPAGMLLQTPSTDVRNAVKLELNNIVLHIAGTMFVMEGDGVLNFIMLDGSAELTLFDASQSLPAGAQSAVPVDLDGYPSIGADGYVNVVPSYPAPYNPALVAALPVNNLPRRFQVVPPQPQDVIDVQIAALSAPPPTSVPTVEPTPTNACRRTVGRNSDILSGPGVDYEALGQIKAGMPILPQLAFTDPRGGIWWQLPESGWVARVDVVERGDCSNQVVPITERVPAPSYNTYSMERCQSGNGPVRAGQSVTFEFVPPAWNSLNEAYAALRTDPGHFEINAERYAARASEPIRVQENVERTEARYLRRFTLNWRAEPGTYRITGDWLHYEPSCNLTVIVE